MTDLRCPCCGGAETGNLGSVGPVPVLCGSLWPSREAALSSPSTMLDLTVCRSCGHVWNSTFEPARVEYDAGYDNSLDHSATFSSFARELAGRLVADFDLHDKAIVEIGAGKGGFLRALCEAGGNRGLGYDPTYEGPEVGGDVTFVRTFFEPETCTSDVDFVCCRHVLEHVPDPYDFLVSVRDTVRGQAVPMYFEVPHAAFNFAESGPWDLIYPHVSYFNEGSLRALFRRAGYRVLWLEESFSGQFLSVAVVPGKSTDAPRASIADGHVAAAFVHAFDRQLATVGAWEERLGSLARSGHTLLWGAGSKGVTFLALVDRTSKVEAVVDVNPAKWGRFLPGTARQVLAPRNIAQQAPSTVLVTNPNYVDEIRDALAEMGLRPDLVLV